MLQNQHERQLCPRCLRNVFPARPKPNLLGLGFSLLLLTIGIILDIIILIFIPYYFWIGAIITLCGSVYLIYYGFLSKNHCPICSTETQPIDYAYPPFKGTPDSFDPSLIAAGKVIRTPATIFDPEGDFVEFIPADKDKEIASNTQTTNIKINFCQICGNKITDGAKFCSKCGKIIE